MCERKNEVIDAAPPGHPITADDDGCSTFQLLTDDMSERDLSGLVQLPDIDDASMAHVFDYVEHYREDIFWSFTSDILFISGGSMFLILSIWKYEGKSPTLWNTMLSILAPFVYLINSVVDITWASRVRQRSKVLSRLHKIWGESSNSFARSAKKFIRIKSTDSKGKAVEVAMKTPSTTETGLCFEKVVIQFHKIRRHAAHRRNVYAALVFGLAALAACLAVAFQYLDGNGTIIYWCQTTSVHMYIVTALMSVTGKRTRPWLPNQACLFDHESLEDLGDLLFLFGSILDGIMCDSTFDDNAAVWNVISASFWWLDATFYLLSDVVMACKFRDHARQPGSPDDASLTLV